MIDQAMKGGSQTPEPTLSFGYFLFLFFYVKDSPTYSRQLLDTISKEDKWREGLLETILLSILFPACSRAGLVPRPSSPQGELWRNQLSTPIFKTPQLSAVGKHHLCCLLFIFIEI